MASPSGIRAGQAFVELFADDSRLVRGLKAASKRLKAWGQSVTAAGQRMLSAGTAAVGGLLGASGVFASMGDTLAKASQRTGIGVERLSELAYAAEQSGADLETLEAGVRKMQKALAEAAVGSESARSALAALGLSITQLAGLSPDKQFMLIADRLSRIADPTLRAAAAMELFGRSGTQLLPMIADGAAGMETLSRRARELGLVMSTEDAQAAVVFGDLVSDLWKTVKMGVFVIGAALAPILSDLAERVMGVIKSVSDWIKQNKDVVVTVFKVAAAVAAGGAALVALGGLISGVGFAFGTLATIASSVGAALGAIGTVLGAILSPIGLVITAVAALGGYLLYVSGAGAQALSWLGQQFAALRDTALAAWHGISDALAAGDIGLAAKILWLTLKMEWQRGIAWLNEKWIGFKETFMAVATEAVYGTAKILTKAWAGIQTAWIETVAFMSKAWTVFTSGLVTGWRTAQNRIAKKFVSLMAMFDDTVDVEATQQILDEDFQREQRGREEATQQQLRDIETTRQARRAAIDQEEKGTLDILDQEKDARHVARRKQYDADQKAAEDAVAEARKEWEAALAEAAKKREEAEATGGPERLKKAGPLEGMDMEAMGKKAVSVQGTFNAMAVRGMGGGGPMERVAVASEEIARNTKDLLREARLGGPVFE